MLKVVFDTNVIISAMLHQKGLPAFLLRLALSHKIKLCYSPEVMAEYEEVAKRKKFKFSQKDIKGLLNEIKRVGIEVFPAQSITLITMDPQDNRILEIAVEANVDYIITGNKKHFPFPVIPYTNIKILTPREFITQAGAYIK